MSSKKTKNILYQVNTNLNSDIREVEYFKKTESYYWLRENGSRDALNTNYCKSFDTKQEAIDYYISCLKSNLAYAEGILKYNQEKLEKFNKKYKIHEQ